MNSIRIRSPFINKLLHEENPDIILLQETKCTDKDFPQSLFPDYECVIYGQKSYNGVAIILRKGIDFANIEKVELGGLSGSRYLQLEALGKTFISVYVPCGGGEVDKFAYKLRFLDDLVEKLKSIPAEEIIIGGDFNVALTDEDVQYPAVYFDSVLCVPEVRTRMRKILENGFSDEVLKSGSFTWWDYRRPFNGLRLDYILTKGIKAKQKVHQEYRRLKIDNAGPSDHVPVTIELE